MPNYFLPFKPGDKVLELGGGDRPQFHPNLDIREGPGVDIVADLNEPLPIDSEIYDGVFGMYIIEHLSWRKVRQFISETHRVLKPSGIGVMITANLLEQCKLAIQWFEQGKEIEVSQMLFGDQGYPENTHMNGFSPSYAIKLFKEAGFHEVTIFEHPNCKTDMIIQAKKSGAKIGRTGKVAPMDRISWIRSKAEGKVLDVGCAGGENFKGTRFEVIYTDINEFSLPNFICADAHHLPFNDNSFDSVVLGELLEHVTNPLQVLKEATRVSRKKVIFTVPNEFAWPVQLKPFMPLEERLKETGLTKKEQFKRDNPTCTKINDLSQAWHRRYYDRGMLQSQLNLIGLPYEVEELNYGSWSFWVGEIRKAPVMERAIRIKEGDNAMKILIISTTVYNLPTPGYSGLEFLCYQWACEFAKQGHSVTVVAPGDSKFPEELSIQLISTGLREPEEAAYLKYKNRLESGEFDAVMDNTWLLYSALSQMEADHQLPVIHIYHSDYANLGSPPPIQYPCLVALSNDQAEGIRRKWGVAVRRVYNGISLDFYKANPEVKRGNRYLWIGRYTPEKMPLETILLAKKCRIGLDMFGDLEIIANQDYANKVFNEADGRQLRVNPGIPREEVVKQMQSHKALIHLVSYNEAFGLVPVECMATGTPVIVNRRGALPELVKNGKSGFVVDTLEQCEEIIKNDLISKIKPEDCVRQAKKFSIEASSKGHLRLLQDVASGILW